jgi:hypothetical protein
LNKGYQVIVAEDFQKALEAFENSLLHMDLVMTEVVFPGSADPSWPTGCPRAARK